ncbi:MAG: hypothetical protein H6Q52_3192 [Deltaproteobacteria bacterium]|nr:hypothetical protein [Deltaproteobacteria bacterium]
MKKKRSAGISEAEGLSGRENTFFSFIACNSDELYEKIGIFPGTGNIEP